VRGIGGDRDEVLVVDTAHSVFLAVGLWMGRACCRSVAARRGKDTTSCSGSTLTVERSGKDRGSSSNATRSRGNCTTSRPIPWNSTISLTTCPKKSVISNNAGTSGPIPTWLVGKPRNRRRRPNSVRPDPACSARCETGYAVKRTELIKEPGAMDCVVIRHGEKYDWYQIGFSCRENTWRRRCVV